MRVRSSMAAMVVRPQVDDLRDDLGRGFVRAVRRDADQHARQLVRNAKNNADQIVAEAKAQAESLMSEARTEVERSRVTAQREIEDLTRQKDNIASHLAQVRQLLGSQMSPIEPGAEGTLDALHRVLDSGRKQKVQGKHTEPDQEAWWTD